MTSSESRRVSNIDSCAPPKGNWRATANRVRGNRARARQRQRGQPTASSTRRACRAAGPSVNQSVGRSVDRSRFGSPDATLPDDERARAAPRELRHEWNADAADEPKCGGSLRVARAPRSPRARTMSLEMAPGRPRSQQPARGRLKSPPARGAMASRATRSRSASSRSSAASAFQHVGASPRLFARGGLRRQSCGMHPREHSTPRKTKRDETIAIVSPRRSVRYLSSGCHAVRAHRAAATYGRVPRRERVLARLGRRGGAEAEHEQHRELSQHEGGDGEEHGMRREEAHGGGWVPAAVPRRYASSSAA